MTKHLVLPDTQLRSGDNLDFIERIGRYIVEKTPDTVVCLGDFADMPSLSSYDAGKKSFEGRRFLLDIEAAKMGNDRLWAPLNEFNEKARKNGKKQYHPRKVMLLGNHENRINRAVEQDAKLEGVLSIDALAYPAYGWEVHDFLDVVLVDGVAYSHYFVTGVAGRPAGSARAQLLKTHQSCIAGHQQGLQIATGNRADGSLITSVICGSCYDHSESYLGPQGNRHFRGLLVLHDVQPSGEFELMPVSLKYLAKKYGE